MKKYYSKLQKTKIVDFTFNYFIPILIILLVTLYYFQKLFPLNGVLAYNDYVLPITKSDMDAYLSNLTIYNINTNLGSVRTNFLSDIPTLLVIKFLSFFLDYQLATKFTQVASFAMVSSVFYLVLRKINKSTVLSFFLSLLIVYNLWSFDRLEQGHYYLLGPFLVILAILIYFRYYSNYLYRNLIVAHLLFFAVLAYYHYAVITIYFLSVDFFVNLILTSEKKKWIKENIVVGIIFFVDMLVFILPYIQSSLNTFKKLSDNVSNIQDLRIFSWQSMAISEVFQIRLGMYSYKIVSNFGVLSAMIIGFILLYYFFFRRTEFQRNVEKRLKISFAFLGFLGFGIWLNFDLYATYIYKIPTMAIFRDMNKFVGIAFIFFIFLLSHKLKSVFEKDSDFVYLRYFFILSCILLLSFVMLPYNLFLVYNQDEIYQFNDPTTFAVATFPSYPLTGLTYNDTYYHKYLPSLASTNNLRTLSIPYPVQQSQYLEEYNLLKSIYSNFDKLTKENVYSQLGNFGVKYIIYYKRYEFKSNDKEIDEWMRSINILDKFGRDEIIFENSDLAIFQLPQEFLTPFVTSDPKSTTELSFKRNNDAEIFVKIKFKDKTNLKLLTNFDPNWKVNLENLNTDFDCQNSVSINPKLNANECKSTNSTDFNFIDNISELGQGSISSLKNYPSAENFNEWTIDSQKILEKVKSDKYKVGSDGSTELFLRISYIPNILFVIGVWILLTNLILSIAWMIWKGKKYV